MAVRIPIDREALLDFCRRHRLRRLAFFGSVVRGREVDLVPLKYLNPRLRDSVLAEAEVQYAA